MTKATDLIAAERDRQVNEEGYDEEHDKGHALQLTDAARVYADAATIYLHEGTAVALPGQWARGRGWPWHGSFWKPTGDPVRDLVKAGALIAAAIDSLMLEPAEDAPAVPSTTEQE